MYIEGSPYKFTYTVPWHNNAAVITFNAPPQEGVYTITFGTVLQVNTQSARAILQVIMSPAGDIYLDALQVQPANSRDVTLIQITARHRPGGEVASDFGANSTYREASLLSTSSLPVGNLQTYTLNVPVPAGGVYGATPAWFAFRIKAMHPTFTGISLDLTYKDPTGEILWGMPIPLPTPVNETVDVSFPFANWNDAYTLMLDLTSLGWREGYFELAWTLPEANGIPVALLEFTVKVADPIVQPVTLTTMVQYTDVDGVVQQTPLDSLFPIVWIGGVSYLVFWTDWGSAPARHMFVKPFVADGFAV
jgi:hypothetical protein